MFRLTLRRSTLYNVVSSKAVRSDDVDLARIQEMEPLGAQELSSTKSHSLTENSERGPHRIHLLRIVLRILVCSLPKEVPP